LDDLPAASEAERLEKQPVENNNLPALQRIKEDKIARKAAQVVPEAKDTVEKMESKAANALAEADNLRDAARLEDLHLWKMEKEFDSRKGKRNMSI
jgi:hypothetical protein